MHLNRIGKEKIKTAMLVLLLAASFVQIGILLGDQSHSLPFNFILGILRSTSAEVYASDNAAREELFVPFRMIASDGTEEHWYISRQDQYYNKLWSSTKQVLKSIAGKNPSSTYEGSEGSEFWGKLVSKKGFVFEFKAKFTGRLLSWALGVSGDMPEAQKIMIIPDIDDEAKLEVYVCSLQADNTYKTLKYITDRKLWSYSAEADAGIYTGLSENERYANSNFSLFKEAGLDTGTLPDVPLIVSPKFRPYPSIYSEKPSQIINIGGQNADEELANTILGSKIVSYNRESFSDEAQFKNSDSIYTIKSSGLLDYKYISSRSDVKNDDIGAALMNAYRFMSNIRRINETKEANMTLYLSSVEKSDTGGYEFKFDYAINGMPIYYNMSFDNGLTEISNAVTITADSENVISCEWMLHNFRISSQFKEYNVAFLDYSAPVGEALKNVFIKNLNIGYVINSESNLEIEPSMVVEEAEPDMKQSGILDIKMPKKGD